MKSYKNEYETPALFEVAISLTEGFLQTSPITGDGFNIGDFNSGDFIGGDNSGEYMD